MTWKREIINYHLNQEYTGACPDLNLDNLISTYLLFPNEALYIIDCQKGELEVLSGNFEKIVGIRRKNQNDLSLLYDHVDESNTPALYHWVMTNLRMSFFRTNGIQNQRDFFKCVYRTIDGRTLLKCTTGLQYDNMGQMRYTLGKLTDITGLGNFRHFDYTYEGPNQESFYEVYKKNFANESPLTSREQEILSILRKERTSQEIAGELFISVHTVDTHRRNIIDKLEVSSTQEAIVKCKNMGWL